MQADKQRQNRSKAGTDGQAEVKKLFAQIQQCVSARDFVKAEALRQDLMALDTIALTEIIAAADLIEAAQSEAMDKDHQALWVKLYETLSAEEANCFYYGLLEKEVAAGTLLARQGGLNDRLLFVEQGKLAAVFRKGEENNLVLQVGKGGFIGEDTFLVCLSAPLPLLLKRKPG